MEHSAQKIQSGSVCRATYATARFGGTLVGDWSHGVPRARSFFPARTWRDVCAEIDQKNYPRAALAATLEENARALGAPEAVLQNARKLAHEKTYAVITGQQAGFLGGPLFTIYKALSAVKLARQYELEAQGAAQFVPVFWVAGDDHDLAEIDHAYFLNADGASVRISAPVAKECEGRSACEIFLSREPEALKKLHDELAALLGGDAAHDLLREYEGRDFEAAFSSLLLKWLGATGIVVARSSCLRKFSAQLLARNLDDFDVSARLVQEAGVALQKCQYEPGFSERTRVAPHFFAVLDADRKRTAIQPEQRGAERVFRVGNFEFTRAQMLEKIEREPERFSTSALLRPVFQDSLFPTAAVVLGPGELAYWAQLRQVHAHYGAVWPVIAPRATLTLLDAAGEKAACKLGLEDRPLDIFLDRNALRELAAAGGELSGPIAARKKALLENLDALRETVAASNAGLLPMLEKIRQKIEHELERFAIRAGSEADKRGEARTLRAEYLAGLVRPRNAPQERILCAAGFMAKFPGLCERLLEVIDPSDREHLIVTF